MREPVVSTTQGMDSFTALEVMLINATPALFDHVSDHGIGEKNSGEHLRLKRSNPVGITPTALRVWTRTARVGDKNVRGGANLENGGASFGCGDIALGISDVRTCLLRDFLRSGFKFCTIAPVDGHRDARLRHRRRASALQTFASGADQSAAPGDTEIKTIHGTSLYMRIAHDT